MRLKEWHRTVVLLVLIVVAVSYIIWLRTGYQTNLIDILR